MHTIKAPLTLLAAAIVLSTLTFGSGLYQVDPAASSITWKGSKIGGSRTGTVSLKNGHLQFSENELTGGRFEIDMNSISTTDLTGRQKKRLDRHLTSKDFFSVKLFPAAKVEITSVEKGTREGLYEIKAKLSIKGISKEIYFTANVDRRGDIANAKADIVFDRAEYDVKYRSGSFFEKLGDKLIYDDVEVTVALALRTNP